VDLRHQGIVDEARRAKDLRVSVRQLSPLRECLDQMIADGVVLKREDIVQQAQAQPPVRG
jgi:hypothetical protein